MKLGLPISFSAHVFIGACVVFGFSKIGKIEPQDRSVTVRLATIDELTNLRASVKSKKRTTTEVPMSLQTPMEFASEEGDPSKRNVESDSQPLPTPDGKDSDDKRPKDDKKQNPVDLKRISDLINKSRESQPEANKQNALASEENFLVYSAEAQAALGEGTALTLSEIDALKQRMTEHWRNPLHAKDAHELIVYVEVNLRRDGSVKDVRLADPEKIAASPNPYMNQAAREALNSVRKGAPYDFLPPEKYVNWKSMTLRFIPEV